MQRYGALEDDRFVPPFVLVLFVSWVLPLALWALDIISARPWGRHANDLGGLAYIGVISLVACVPLTALMILVFRLLIRATTPALSRWVAAIHGRWRRRRGETGVITPTSPLASAYFSTPSVAVPLGALLGAGVGFLHPTGWMSFFLFSRPSSFFFTVAFTGAAVGALMGMRAPRMISRGVGRVAFSA